MKRIATLLAVLLLAACAKMESPQPGRYVGASGNADYAVTIIGGQCVSFEFVDRETGATVVAATGWETKGRWPNYTYTCKTQLCDATLRAKFSDTSSFAGSLNGRMSDGSTSLAIETATPITYTLSADFQQTDFDTK